MPWARVALHSSLRLELPCRLALCLQPSQLSAPAGMGPLSEDVHTRCSLDAAASSSSNHGCMLA